MPITREMIRKALLDSERKRNADREIIAANRRYWREFLRARRAERMDMKAQVEALLK